ncbi:RNA-directed DNA polymerase, eukaryota [Tanacetum coccineum]|uniref:RNA-directed DNA polymerase, eukaryota n=1 Tax=Tanacetum coccineum TaxID=301880 RepID=A0ABQ4YCA1_9ASTR
MSSMRCLISSQKVRFPKVVNASFIALIPKMQDAKVAKDYRPISLISSLYKIIAKILANRLVVVLGDLVSEVQSAFIANRQILEGLILVNGIPTGEFHFRRGLKQGDPLSPFLFILVMESLHLSFQNVVNEGLFKDCFHKASGLYMNLQKSKLLGFAVEDEKVSRAAMKMGCCTLKTPFSYLGIKVGGMMSRIKSWDEIVDKLQSRLSKWKMKTLSIGGRLTLLKSMLGSTPIYYISMFKVPSKVLKCLEDIRR